MENTAIPLTSVVALIVFSPTLKVTFVLANATPYWSVKLAVNLDETPYVTVTSLAEMVSAVVTVIVFESFWEVTGLVISTLKIPGFKPISKHVVHLTSIVELTIF